MQWFTVCTDRNNFSFALPHDKTNKMSVRPAKTRISLGIRPVWSFFPVHMKKPWVLSYPLSTQRRLWSDWADAQADLSWHFVGFVMRWLILSQIKHIKVNENMSILLGLFQKKEYRGLWRQSTIFLWGWWGLVVFQSCGWLSFVKM